MKAARLVIVFVFACLLFPAVVYAEPATPTPPLTGAATNRLSEIELVSHEGGELTVAEIQGDYIYAGIGPSLSILDVSEPAKPVLVGKAMLPTFVSALAVSGERAYVATGWNISDKTTNILHVFDVSNPDRPVELGQLGLPSYANAIFRMGEILYVPTHVGGLLVIDVSNPYRPLQLVQMPFLDGIKYGALYGNYLYLSGFYIVILDISDPSRPSVVSHIPTNRASQIAVVDGHLYTLSCDEQIIIYDLDDPRTPSEVQRFYPGYCPDSFTLAGNLMYVLTRGKGLTILDVTNAAAPGGLSEQFDVGPSTVARHMSVDGDLLIVYEVYKGTGISLIDVSDPRAPGLASVYTTYAYEYGPNPSPVPDGAFPDIENPIQVVYRGDYAYLIASGGFHVFDVSDSDVVNGKPPRLLASYLTDLLLFDIEVAGPYAYVASHKRFWLGVEAHHTDPGGLHIFDILAPTNPVLIDWIDLPGAGAIKFSDGLITLLGGSGGTYTVRFGSTVQGTMVDSIGEPIPEVEVSLSPQQTAVTNQQGQFTIYHLTKGGYQLSLNNPNWVTFSPSFLIALPQTNPWNYVAYEPLISVPSPDDPKWKWVVLPRRVSGEYASGVDVSLTLTNVRGLATSVVIPGSAVTETVEVHLTPRIPSPDTGLMPTSNAFYLEIFSGMAPLSAQIVINYSESDLRWINNESDLDLYVYTGEGWLPTFKYCAFERDRIHDLDANRIEVTVCGSGLYSLMGPTTNQVFIPLIRTWYW